MRDLREMAHCGELQVHKRAQAIGISIFSPIDPRPGGTHDEHQWLTMLIPE